MARKQRTLDASQVERIRELAKQKVTQKEIAAQIGCSKSIVCSILWGRSYRTPVETRRVFVYGEGHVPHRK